MRQREYGCLYIVRVQDCAGERMVAVDQDAKRTYILGGANE